MQYSITFPAICQGFSLKKLDKFPAGSKLRRGIKRYQDSFGGFGSLEDLLRLRLAGRCSSESAFSARLA